MAGAPPLDPTLAAAETVATEATPSPGGDVIGGRYQILGLLGAGGMGSVYRVRDLELDEVVALKMLHHHMLSDAGMLARFRQEVKLARRVTHRNVARTFDIGEQAGVRFLTMELIDGEPLSAVLRRRRSLPPGEACTIVRSVCDGLAAAHAVGVVHRDLKPDNVLFTRDGRVVVTDFGIARAPEGSAAQTLGMMVGTPAYMSPEQVEADTVDGRADVYALGAVLFEMLTGRRAWPGDAVMAVAAARLVHPPPDPAALVPSLPADLCAVVRRCLARRPEERFADVAQLAAALAPFAGATPAPAPAMTRPPARGPEKTLAVLPLRNGGPPEDEFLADGLTEDLTDELSMTHGLKVRARGAAAPWKGRDLDPRELGRALEVQVVVEGSIRRIGETVRLTVRLLNVADGFQLWARRFERPLGQALQVNEEAAQAIAEALSAHHQAPARAAAVDPVAIEQYLRARQGLITNILPPPGVLQLFEEALGRAPDEPRILSGYAMALTRFQVETRLEHAELRRRARVTAERALELAPEMGEPWLALAAVQRAENDDAGAMPSVRRALRNAPSLAEGEDMVGRTLLEVGEIEEAIIHLDRASWLDPLLLNAHSDRLRAAALLGRWTEVAELLERQLDERLMSMRWFARVRFHLWNPKALPPPPPQPPMPNGAQAPSRLGAILLDILGSGRFTSEHQQRLSELIAQVPEGSRPRRFFSQLGTEFAAFLDDDELALVWVERAVREGLIDVAWMDRAAPLARLRADPRFAALRAEVEARAAVIRAAWRDGQSSLTAR